MKLSTRNQLTGTVTAIAVGEAMAVVKVDVAGTTITSSITRESATDLGLAEGSEVTVLVKSTDVMLGVN